MSLGMEDYESHVRMQANGVRGVALPRSFFRYRIRANSMARSFNTHIQAYLQRRVIANNAGFYDRHGARLCAMFAENGHGALATPPTVRTPANAALFGHDIATLEEVNESLEKRASRERLARALRARAHHGGAAWDYTVARLLLALDLQAEFAERCLLAAIAQEPHNPWYRLYGIVASLRAGRPDAATAMWSRAFQPFCQEENGAVLWVASLESVRGFPKVNQFFQARLSQNADDGDRLVDPILADLRHALTAVAVATSGDRAQAMRQAVHAFYAAAHAVASPQASTAALSRWLAQWTADGELDAAAPQRLAAAVATERPLAEHLFFGLAGEPEWLAVLDSRRAKGRRNTDEQRLSQSSKPPHRALPLLRRPPPSK